MRYSREILLTGLAIKSGVRKSDVDAVLSALTWYVGAAIQLNDSVFIRGFGTFHPRISRRTGRRVVGFKTTTARQEIHHDATV